MLGYFLFWKIKASPQDHHDSSVLMIPNMWPIRPIIFKGNLLCQRMAIARQCTRSITQVTHRRKRN